MKICYIAEHYPPHLGGVETVFAEYVQRMRQRGHDVRVITSASGGVQGITDESGAIVYHYSWPSLFTHPIPWRWQLDQHVRWSDVVHTTTYTAGPLALASARRAQKPCIITVHEALGKRWHLIEPVWWKARLFQAVEKYSIIRPYSRWHVVSHATKQDLHALGISADNIHMIYHGIDEKRWHSTLTPADLHQYFGIDRTRRIFLFSGRPGPTKGLFLLAEAIAQVKQQLQAEYVFGFLLASEPKREYQKFLRLVEQLGIHNQVVIRPVIAADQMPSFRKAAWAGIVPSLTEGFGFTAAEMSALGVPLIVSDAGSLSEVVGGKVLFFKAGNVHDLAEKIMMATRQQFSTQPQPHFSWNETTSQLNQLYEEVIASRRAQ